MLPVREASDSSLAVQNHDAMSYPETNAKTSPNSRKQRKFSVFEQRRSTGGNPSVLIGDPLLKPSPYIDSSSPQLGSQTNLLPNILTVADIVEGSGQMERASHLQQPNLRKDRAKSRERLSRMLRNKEKYVPLKQKEWETDLRVPEGLTFEKMA